MFLYPLSKRLACYSEGRTTVVMQQHTLSLVYFTGDYYLSKEIELNSQIESNMHALLVSNVMVEICVV